MSNTQEALSALPQEIVDEIKDNPVLKKPIEEVLEEVWDKLSERTKVTLSLGSADYLYQLLSYDVSIDGYLQTNRAEGVAQNQTKLIQRALFDKTTHDLGDWKEHRDALMALKPEDFSSKLDAHWLASAFPNSKLSEMAPDVLDAFLKAEEMQLAMESLEQSIKTELPDFLMGQTKG